MIGTRSSWCRHPLRGRIEPKLMSASAWPTSWISTSRFLREKNKFGNDESLSFDKYNWSVKVAPFLKVFILKPRPRHFKTKPQLKNLKSQPLVGQAGVFQVQFYLIMSWLDSNLYFKVSLLFSVIVFDSRIVLTKFKSVPIEELEEWDDYEHPADKWRIQHLDTGAHFCKHGKGRVKQKEG